MPETTELVFLPNGMVRAVLDGTPHMLRRPKLGEFRKFREALHQANEEEKALLKEKDKTASHLLQDRMQEIALGWIRDVFTALGDKAFPADDDVPPWLPQTEFMVRLLNHWQQLPLAPSAK